VKLNRRINTVRMKFSSPTLQIQTNLSVLKQLLPDHLIPGIPGIPSKLHTPLAGKPKASRRAGAAKENRHENPISQIARFGGDMNQGFPKSLKNTDAHMQTHTRTHRCTCAAASTPSCAYKFGPGWGSAAGPCQCSASLLVTWRAGRAAVCADVLGS